MGGPDQDRVAAFARARVVITGVDEIGHTDFTVHGLSARFRQANLAHTLLTALMVEEQACAGVFRKGDDAMHGLAFGRGGTGRQVRRRVSLALRRPAAQLLDDVEVLGVKHRQPLARRDDLHCAENRHVVQLHSPRRP